MVSRRDFLKIAAAAAGYYFISGCDDGMRESPPTGPPEPTHTLEENLATLVGKVTDPTARIIAYSPTNYNPNIGAYPSEASIRADLEALANYGFNGILTYGSWGILGSIPRIATEVGFTTIITGVWDPKNNQDLGNAINSHPYSHGFCIGNEQLTNLYTFSELENAIIRVREETHRPTTTTQQYAWYSDPLIVGLGDFLLPNAHPWWENVRQPAPAADYLVQKYNEMKGFAGGKLVLMKESGLPSAGSVEASELNQKDFFTELSLRKSGEEVYYACFEAYDQPWKNWAPVEPYWGLCRSDRSPKLVLQ